MKNYTIFILLFTFHLQAQRTYKLAEDDNTYSNTHAINVDYSDPDAIDDFKKRSGSVGSEFKTITYINGLFTDASNSSNPFYNKGGSGVKFLCHGVSGENPTITFSNVTVSAAHSTKDGLTYFRKFTVNSSGRVTLTGLTLDTLLVTGSGSTYIENCSISNYCIKSGNGYLSFAKDCDLLSATMSITGLGNVVFQGGTTPLLTINNSLAAVTYDCTINGKAITLTLGGLLLNSSTITSTTSTSNAITSSASGTLVKITNCTLLQPDQVSSARINLAGSNSIAATPYDFANSTVANNLGAKYLFDNILLLNAPTVSGKTLQLVKNTDGSFAWQTITSGSTSFPTSSQGQLYDDGTGTRSYESSVYMPFITNKAYPANHCVVYNNNLYASNSVIPANTAFSLGTSGATWRLIGGNTTMGSNTAVFVSTFGSNIGNNGTVTQPYSTLQAGHDYASATGGNVYVYSGDYTGTLVVNNKNNLSISGLTAGSKNRISTTDQVSTTGSTVGFALKDISIITSGTTVPLLLADAGLNHNFENIIFKPNSTTTPILFDATAFSTLASGTYTLTFKGCDFGGNTIVGATVPSNVFINIYLYNCKNFKMNALLDRWSIYHLNNENFTLPISLGTNSSVNLIGSNYNKVNNIASTDKNGLLPYYTTEQSSRYNYSCRNRIYNSSYNINTMNTNAEYATFASAGAYVCDYNKIIGLNSGGCQGSVFDAFSTGKKYLRLRPSTTFTGTNKMLDIMQIFSADAIGMSNNYCSFQIKHRIGTGITPTNITVTIYAPNTIDGFVQMHELSTRSGYTQLVQFTLTPNTSTTADVTYKSEGFLLSDVSGIGADNGLEIEIAVTHSATNDQSVYYFTEPQLEVGTVCTNYIENKNRRTITNKIPINWNAAAQGDITNTSTSKLPFSGGYSGNAAVNTPTNSYKNGFRLTNGGSQIGNMWLLTRNVDWCRSFKVTYSGHMNTSGEMVYFIFGSNTTPPTSSVLSATTNTIMAKMNVFAKDVQFYYNGSVVGVTTGYDYQNNGWNTLTIEFNNSINNVKVASFYLNGIWIGGVNLTSVSFRAAGDYFSVGAQTNSGGVDFTGGNLKFEYTE